MISTSEEATTPENEQIQADVRELREDLATIQDGNDGTRKTILIGLAFFCLFLIFKPGGLGFSMYDWATSECYWTDTGPPYYEDGSWDCESRDEARAQVAMLGIISLSCFYFTQRKPDSEEDSATEEEEPEQEEPEQEEPEQEEPEQEEPEQEEPEKEVVVLSPLEEKKKTLAGHKKTKKLLVLAVVMIPIICIQCILTPVDTGLQEYREGGESDQWAWGLTAPDLMLNALEALDVNNCINKSSAWYSGFSEQEKQEICQDLVDSAEQTITLLAISTILVPILGYLALKKKNEEIAQMQDSILEMEEQ